MEPIQQPVQSPSGINIFQPKPNYLKTIIFSVLGILLVNSIIYLYLQNQKLKKQVLNPQVFPTAQVPSPTISISLNKIEGWTKYKNDNFKFSFSYPKKYILLDQLKIIGDNILLQNYQDKPNRVEESTDFQLVIFVGKDEGKDLEEYPKLWQSDLGELSSKKILIGGINAVEGFSGQKYQAVPTIWLKNNGYLYTIQLSTPNVANKQMFDQILSTFKFASEPTKTIKESKLGYIRSITPNYDNYVVSVDLIQMIDDKSQPNGYRIDNPSTETINFPLEQNISITQITFGSDGKQIAKTISLGDFIKIIDSNPSSKVPYTLDIENGSVIKIAERFIP